MQESGAAREILRHAGFEISKFGPRQDDPPDCEGFLDRQWSAVEVTRLTHEKTRALSMKAISQGKPPYYYEWEREELLGEIKTRITNKEKGAARYKGGPYQRYVLVIHTAEFRLDAATMREFLDGTTFRTAVFTDVVVGLSPEHGGCPTFRLSLVHQD